MLQIFVNRQWVLQRVHMCFWSLMKIKENKTELTNISILLKNKL